MLHLLIMMWIMMNLMERFPQKENQQGQTRTTTAQRPPSRAGSAGEFVWFWKIRMKIADDFLSFWSNQKLVNTWIKRPSPKPDVSLVDDGQDDKKVGRVGVWCFWRAGNYVGEMDVEWNNWDNRDLRPFDLHIMCFWILMFVDWWLNSPIPCKFNGWC